jgi:predicted small lipoprotein YifL
VIKGPERGGGHNVAVALGCGKLAGAFGELALARVELRLPLIPAKAGIQRWVPAFAGTSGRALGLALLATAALALAGCGRNGPLELPPGPAVPAPQASTAPLTYPDGTPIPGSERDTAAKTGFDQYGRPVAAQGERKSFILDPLLQ